MPIPVVERLLGLWVRIPPGAWMFVFCVSCSKNKRQSRDKEVQLKYREQKKKVAELSKARVCGCLLVGIAGLNLAGALVSFSYECCVLSDRGLCD
jgi:hypothetical protein